MPDRQNHSQIMPYILKMSCSSFLDTMAEEEENTGTQQWTETQEKGKAKLNKKAVFKVKGPEGKLIGAVESKESKGNSGQQ